MVRETEKSHGLPHELEKQKNQGRNSVPVGRSENRGANGVSPGLCPKAQGRGTLMPEGKRGWMSQLWQKERSAFLPFCGWVVPPALMEVIFLAQSTDSNVNIAQRHPHRHTQKYVLMAILAPLIPVKLTHKISILHV